MNLNQVTVYAADVPASAAFYRKLGLRLIVDALPRYARFECPNGAATFSIHRRERAAASETVVYFECADLDEKVAELKNLGIRFESDPADQPWLWRESYLRDPSGNRICLYYAGANRQNPPWRVRS